MSDKKYTKDHEWILLEGENATVGITDSRSRKFRRYSICGFTRNR